MKRGSVGTVLWDWYSAFEILLPAKQKMQKRKIKKGGGEKVCMKNTVNSISCAARYLGCMTKNKNRRHNKTICNKAKRGLKMHLICSAFFFSEEA